MSGLIPHLSISQSLVFLLNSRLGHFSAPQLPEDPFFRSYRVDLPNSLAMTHSSTFGYSPRPPVSVSGTGGQHLKLSGFSGEYAPHRCHLGRSLGVLSRLGSTHVLDCVSFTWTLQPSVPSDGGCFAPPSPLRNAGRYGNINPLSIGCPSFTKGSS